MKKLACFFAGGYTEAAGYMQLFLDKISDKYVYEQCIPNSTRIRRGTSKIIKDSYSGLTGERLLDTVYEYLNKPYIKERFNNGDYAGVLLEDDLDGRFDSFDENDINNWETRIRSKIANILDKKVPVFFVYAAPEIESWFISDWNNGFGKFLVNSSYFCKLDTNYRKKYAFDLKKDIDNKLLNNGKIPIEKYAFEHGEYRKLSEDLQLLINERNNATMEKLRKVDNYYENVQGFCYSKKVHGPSILKNISPENVVERCNIYFGRSYLSLK